MYVCEDHKGDLLKVFGIDYSSDTEGVHPPYFCERCNAVVVKAIAAANKKKIYLHSVTVFTWSGHTQSDCHVCDQVVVSKKGGRPKKTRKNRGRPTAVSAHTRLEQLRKNETESYLPGQVERGTLVYFVPSSLGVQQSDLECPVCTALLDRPVQVQCGAVLCTECVYR